MMEIITQLTPYLLIAALVFLAIVLAWIIYLALQINRLKRKSEELFSGNKVKNLEELLLEQSRSLKLLDKDIQELYSISNQINKLAFQGLHKVGLVRFNPFKDIGGNQSFSIAILNGKNNGLVISSLYTREGARVYSKAVLGTKSKEHPLTEEEKEAIKMAVNLNKAAEIENNE